MCLENAVHEMGSGLLLAHFNFSKKGTYVSAPSERIFRCLVSCADLQTTAEGNWEGVQYRAMQYG
jgi:hypothetical protein